MKGHSAVNVSAQKAGWAGSHPYRHASRNLCGFAALREIFNSCPFAVTIRVHSRFVLRSAAAIGFSTFHLSPFTAHRSPSTPPYPSQPRNPANPAIATTINGLTLVKINTAAQIAVSR
jgi:hypothetical protein